MSAERSGRGREDLRLRAKIALGSAIGLGMMNGGVAAETLRRRARQEASVLPTTEATPEVPVERSAADISREKWVSRAKTTAKVLAVGAAVGLIGREVYKRRKNGEARGLGELAEKVIDRTSRAVDATKSVATVVLDSDPASKPKVTGKDIAKVASGAVVLGLAGAGADAVGVVLKEHREDTHQSVRLAKWLVKAIEFSRRSLGGNDPRGWPDVHLDHHAYPDKNLMPFLEVSRMLNWVEQQKAEGKVIDAIIPPTIKHLDPLVDDGEYPTDLVRQIGDLTEEDIAKKKLGDLYKAPEAYTRDEIIARLYPSGPDYFYEPYKKKRQPEDYPPDGLTRTVVRDPHAPDYADMHNGVGKILRTGFWPYQTAVNSRQVHPEIVADHLQPLVEGDLKKVGPAVAAGIAIPAAVILAARGKYEPKDFAIAAVGGALADGTRGLMQMVASMTVNGLGHAGSEMGEKFSAKRVWKATFGREYKSQLDADGNVATNIRKKSLLATAIRLFTLGEVTGQRHHHLWPKDRIYSLLRGREGFAEDPVGSIINAMAESDHPLLGFIQPGNDFKGVIEEGERRLDMPHPAAELMRERRKQQYQVDQARREREETRAREAKERLIYRSGKPIPLELTADREAA